MKLFLALLVAYFSFAKAQGEFNNDSNLNSDSNYTSNVWKPKKPTLIPIVAHIRSGVQGQNEDPTVGSLEWKDGKWHLDINIGIWGVNTFSRVTKTQWELARKFQLERGEPNPIQAKYFSKTFELLDSKELLDKLPKSFEDIPDLAEVIRQQIKKIEQSFNTDFLSTRIKLHFIDESQLVDKKKWIDPKNISPVISEKIFGSNNKNLNFLPLKYSPIPNNEFITPGEADPFTWPELMAHEIFHLLSRNHFNDGFPFANYPLQGVMNGGEQFTLLRQQAGSQKLLAIELNTLLASQLDYAKGNRDIYSVAEGLGVPSYYTEAVLYDRLVFYSENSLDKTRELELQIKRYHNQLKIKNLSSGSCLKFYLK